MSNSKSGRSNGINSAPFFCNGTTFGRWVPLSVGSNSVPSVFSKGAIWLQNDPDRARSGLRQKPDMRSAASGIEELLVPKWLISKSYLWMIRIVVDSVGGEGVYFYLFFYFYFSSSDPYKKPFFYCNKNLEMWR
jgi:hypothetical protein